MEIIGYDQSVLENQKNQKCSVQVKGMTKYELQNYLYSICVRYPQCQVLYDREVASNLKWLNSRFARPKV